MEKKTKKIIYNVVITCLLLCGLAYVCSRFMHLGNVEYTDNAQVKQHITPVNARVGGFIREVRFDEYQQVKKGDTLLIIEDAEYRLRVAQAEADLANALAGKQVTNASIQTTQSNISVNDAGVEEARIQMENAQREWQRYEKLLADDAVTGQQADNVRTAYIAAKARYERALSTRSATTRVKNEQTQRLSQNESGIKLAQAALDLARLNLSYTVVIATCNGRTGRKEVHEGQLVQPGQTMVDIVDEQEIWVRANYRETQLRHISVGARAELTADALPGVVFEGVVEKISDATGAAYSALPQDNATGNFVKVEQRVPVRINLKGNDKEQLEKLRAGLNMECKVKY